MATPALLLLAAFFFLRPSSHVGRRVSLWVDRYTSELHVAQNWPELIHSSFRLYRGELEPDVLFFADFECPYCIANVPAIDSAVDAGVRVGYIHSPAERNIRAREASIIAVCAAQSGQSTKAYDFYARGIEWRSVSDSVLVPASIDSNELRTCISDTEAAEIVDHSIALAAEIGINGTPTFATKSRVRVGMQSTAQLLKLARKAH